MNQWAYCNSGGLRHQKRQRTPTTLVRLLPYLLTASCAVAQSGKLSAEKQAKIEIAISNFMATSKAPGISAQKTRIVTAREFLELVVDTLNR